ncbi:MAG: hypothetical protein ACRDT6_23175 [Micromonosporaceae bacterium]
MYSVELSHDELRIARSALRSYLNDFGHDEVDVLRLVKRILAKISEAEAAGDSDADPAAETA